MNLNEMTDEQCMEVFQDLIRERIKLGTAYITDPATDLLTHQFLVIECGNLMAQSTPEKLSYHFQPVGYSPENRTIN